MHIKEAVDRYDAPNETAAETRHLRNVFLTPHSMAHLPTCLDDFEKHAWKVLPPAHFGYYYSGADAETTLARNKAAYDRSHEGSCNKRVRKAYHLSCLPIDPPEQASYSTQDSG
ncbi:hypothetical protein BC938DRAFT_477894 [Jimgerdemannia flammicorona]|uniref:Uncharacterized protein n=1 Tax=Jimgerdemannia flammicorona TaxID=994334 RepID=A0A433QNP7_9FUNG|nr:hypothetical protein BC938DRAFT_477894 [Jimgerdemannia flammicorona]